MNWIPCSERMPDVAGDFLALSRSGNVHVNRLLLDGRWNGIVESQVTHWCPIPEKPNPDFDAFMLWYEGGFKPKTYRVDELRTAWESALNWERSRK